MFQRFETPFRNIKRYINIDYYYYYYYYYYYIFGWQEHLGPDCLALLTVSTESSLMEAGNYVLTASILHGLAANFGSCVCALHFTTEGILCLQGLGK